MQFHPRPQSQLVSQHAIANARRTVAQALAPSAATSDALAHCVQMLAAAGRQDLIAELEASAETQRRMLGVAL